MSTIAGSRSRRLPGAVAACALAASLPARAAEAAAPFPLADKAVEVLAGLAVVLIAIAATSWVSKRLLRFQSARDGELRIVSGISVGARDRVVLLEVGETQLLLAVSPGRIETLHVLDEPLAASAPPPGHPVGTVSGEAAR